VVGEKKMLIEISRAMQVHAQFDCRVRTYSIRIANPLAKRASLGGMLKQKFAMEECAGRAEPGRGEWK
jgi:hypothetical protein